MGMSRSTFSNGNVPSYDPWTQTRPVGSRVMMWKQDPTVGEIGVRKVFLPLKVLEGPRDDRIVVRGVNPVRPDKQGDFLNIQDSAAFDAVHTYAVVRQTLTMYERALAVGKQPAQIRWIWNDSRNNEPITVLPYGLPNEANAYYTRSQKALTFGYFQATSGQQSGRVYTCRSLDVVSHETGHAILDGFKPNWLLANSPPQTGALHESFGDLTAIFLILSMLDMVEAAIAETGAHLRDRSFLVDLAEEFGNKGGLGRTDGLRNAANENTVSQAGLEVHDLSCVFTGAVFDILADIFMLNRRPDIKDDAVVLHTTAAQVRSLFIRAIIASPDSNAVFSDVARAMLNISRNDRDPLEYQDIIVKCFEEREIWVSSSGYPTSRNPSGSRAWGYTAAASVVGGIGTDAAGAEYLRAAHIHASALPGGAGFEQDRSHCCITMKRRCKHPEHRGFDTCAHEDSTIPDEERNNRTQSVARETGVVQRGGGTRSRGRRDGGGSTVRSSLPPEWVQPGSVVRDSISRATVRGPISFPTESIRDRRGYDWRGGAASDSLSSRRNQRSVGRVYGTKNGQYLFVNGTKSDKQSTVVIRHTNPRVLNGSLRETVL